jgi:hypothetical protein
MMMAVVAITVPGRCFNSGSAQYKDHHQQATDPAHLSRSRLHDHGFFFVCFGDFFLFFNGR